MSFDLIAMGEIVEKHGALTRIVVAQTQGSVPREVGASMLLWESGQSGTIGGGALELDAAQRAISGKSGLERIPLGPGLGQCCGGAVTLLTERWDAEKLAGLTGASVVRRVDGDKDMPLALRTAIRQARSSGLPALPRLVDGWMLEPVSKATRHIWIFGAGHVGRAIVTVLAPFPEIALTWIDTATDRYPQPVPGGVTKLIAKNPADLVQYAPIDAEHLVLTYSHALDLEICHRLLGHGFGTAGLIGSKTKWVRFQRKLAALGHTAPSIARINCPIGQPALGKHPQAIAVGVANQMLTQAKTLNISNQRVG